MKIDRRTVTGCSSCPMAYLDNGCVPRCILSAEPDVAKDHGPGRRVEQYAFRDDVPPECPLRKGALHVALSSKGAP